MNLKSIFSRIETLSVDEAREWIEKRNPESYTLLDVRQPEEYEKGHIPGATLIPLPELSDRAFELPEDLPVIAY